MDETTQALAFVRRTQRAHDIAIQKLEAVITKKKRSAGKAPPIQEEEGRHAVG